MRCRKPGARSDSTPFRAFLFSPDKKGGNRRIYAGDAGARSVLTNAFARYSDILRENSLPKARIPREQPLTSTHIMPHYYILFSAKLQGFLKKLHHEIYRIYSFQFMHSAQNLAVFLQSNPFEPVLCRHFAPHRQDDEHSSRRAHFFCEKFFEKNCKKDVLVIVYS